MPIRKIAKNIDRSHHAVLNYLSGNFRYKTAMDRTKILTSHQKRIILQKLSSLTTRIRQVTARRGKFHKNLQCIVI